MLKVWFALFAILFVSCSNASASHTTKTKTVVIHKHHHTHHHVTSVVSVPSITYMAPAPPVVNYQAPVVVESVTMVSAPAYMTPMLAPTYVLPNRRLTIKVR